jgi:peptide alpha-N-acetyltransferase
MPPIVKLIERDLSEPYSIFTYRYFINNWPNLCFLVRTAVDKVQANARLTDPA